MKTFLRFLMIALFIGAINQTYAATCTSTGTGNWGTAGTWSCGTIPANTDDVIIANGHIVTNEAVRTWGGVGRTLTVQTGGILTATALLTISGTATFVMETGAKYVHNVAGSFSGITSGIESFSATSELEIKNMSACPSTANMATPFGNVTIDLPTGIASQNCSGSWTNIAGNLTVKSTGTAGNELRLSTKAITLTMTIGGNLSITGGILNLANAASGTGTANRVLTVTGNVSMSAGKLDLGNTSGTGILYTSGNLDVSGGVIARGTGTNGIVLRGVGKTLQVADGVVANPIAFIVDTGASYTCNGYTDWIGASVIGGNNFVFGTLNVADKVLELGSTTEVRGGTLTVGSGGIVRHQGTGGYSFTVCRAPASSQVGISVLPSSTCGATGNEGLMTIDAGTVAFAKSASTIVTIGSGTTSPGTLRLLNGGTFGASGGGSGTTSSINLTGTNASVLEIDATSKIDGAGTFTTTRGVFKIGSPDGITTSGATGNIQVTGSRFYTNGTATDVTFEYNGAAAQVTGNGFPNVAANSPQLLTLKVNNASNVTLTQTNTPGAFTGNSSLNLTAGKLILGANNFNVTSGGSLTGGSASSYVQTDGAGRLCRLMTAANTIQFPIGRSAYNPVTNFVNNGTNDSYCVRVEDALPATPLAGQDMPSRFWDYTEGTAGGSDVDLTQNYNSGEEPAGFYAQIYLSWIHYNGTTWDGYVAGTCSSGTNSCSYTSIPAFSGGGGGGGAAPPPVMSLAIATLSSAAALRGDDALLTWTTASETNNDSFSIEQQEGSGEWKTIATVKGAGNSTDTNKYAYEVKNLRVGLHKFRIKDSDGVYGATLTLLKELPDAAVLYDSYPNPFSATTTIDFAVAKTQNVKVELYNVLGQKVATLLDANVTGNEIQSIELNAEALTSGQYFVRFSGEGFAKMQTISIVK